MSRALPTSIEDVDSEWVTGVLRGSGRLASTESVQVVSSEPFAAGTAFTTRMYRIFLSGSDAVPKTMVVKLAVEGPNRALIDAIGIYTRELAFYRDLASETPVRVPRMYIGETAEDSTDMVLAIEDLSSLGGSADQLEGLTLDQARAAADEIARFHAWSWQHPRLAGLAEHFPPLDSPQGRGRAEQFGQFLTQTWPVAEKIADGRLPDEVVEFGRRLPSLTDFFVERLGSPRTIVHGELRADNLFFQADGSLVLLDFQTVQQASGAGELGYLISQSIPTDVRRGHDEELVRRYWEALRREGVTDYPWDQAWEQYRLGVAYNIIFPGMAAMSYEGADARGQALLVQMLARAGAAIVDNHCLELLRGIDA